MEAHHFSDGSDRLRLELDSAGVGTVLLGDAALLEPATDPEVWPYSPRVLSLEPGIQYPVLGALVEQRRLRTNLDSMVLVRPWCELQTPILDETNNSDDPTPRYYCTRSTGTRYVGKSECFVKESYEEDAEWEPVDCGKLELCGVPTTCQCSADGCKVAEQEPATLDAAWSEDGDALHGTLTTADGNLTMRLYRQR